MRRELAALAFMAACSARPSPPPRPTMAAPTSNSAVVAPANVPHEPTRRQELREHLFGVAVDDPYRWLEAGDDPEVIQWVERQNAATQAYLAKSPARG
ncbi:MAG TPA: S9 family peptidase, partial [Polyangiaceae bacterium]|nr:S9 family peptidase [Polyangiaceae bacterium]